ncbi:MAG: tetratricopeptide repeat protein [Gammaproteobacteria bacterium]
MRKVLLIVIMIAINAACSGEHHEENETFMKAQTCRQQGSPEKAEKMATNYLHQYPDDPDMKLLLASIYFQKNDYAKAKELLQPAVKQYPNYTDLSTLLTRVNQAQEAQAAGKTDTSMPGATSLNDDNLLNNKNAALDQVRALKADGELEEAKKLAWKYLKKHPFDLDMQTTLLSIYYGTAARKVIRPKYPCE